MLRTLETRREGEMPCRMGHVLIAEGDSVACGV